MHLVNSLENVLPGDALIITEARVGHVFRQRMGETDYVIKVHSLCLPRDETEEGDHETITRELQREADAYHVLERLQGDIIPRFYGLGPLKEGVWDALTTKYSGNRVDLARLTRHQKQQSMGRLNPYTSWALFMVI